MAAADSPTQIPGFRDRIGERFVVPQPSGALLEYLYFCQPLASAPFFEGALKQRVSRLANFRQASYCRIRRVQHVVEREGNLALVSAHAGGRRLAEILQIAARADLKPTTSAVLGITRQLMAAVALLHDFGPDVFHGALGPERVILAADGRVVVAEHVLGDVIEQAASVWSSQRLWREFGVAVLHDGIAPQFGRRVDVVQIGAVTLAMLLGRSLRTHEYPGELAALLDTATETTPDGEAVPLRSGLRSWLERALEFRADASFRTLHGAQRALGQLIQDEGYGASSVAWDSFVAVCEIAAAKLALLVVEPERPPEEPSAAPETVAAGSVVLETTTVESVPEAGAAQRQVEAEIAPVHAEPPLVEPLPAEGGATESLEPEADVVEPLAPDDASVVAAGAEPFDIEPLTAEGVATESLEPEADVVEPLAPDDASVVAAGAEPVDVEPLAVEGVAAESLEPETDVVEPLARDDTSVGAAGLESVGVEPLPVDEGAPEPILSEEPAVESVGAEAAGAPVRVPTPVEEGPQEEPAAAPSAPFTTAVEPPSHEKVAEESAPEPVSALLLDRHGGEAVGVPVALAAAALGVVSAEPVAAETTSAPAGQAQEPDGTPSAAASGVPQELPGPGAGSESSAEVGLVYETLGISAPPPRLLDQLAPTAQPSGSTATPQSLVEGAEGSAMFDDWAPLPDPAMNPDLVPETLFEVPPVPTPDVVVVADHTPVPAQSTEGREKAAPPASLARAQEARPVDLDASHPAVVAGEASRRQVTRPATHAAPRVAPPAVPASWPKGRGRVIRRTLVAGVGLMVVAAAVYGLVLWAPWRGLTSPTGIVKIESDPPGATLTIDGQSHGKTPAEVTLSAGPHQLLVQAGAAARSKRIVVAAGARMKETLALRGGTVRGGLRITTSPTKGRITIDGKVRGDAPIRVMDLEPGTHTMFVESPFGIQEHEVVVEAGKTSSVLVPTASWIKVAAPHELAVIENGRRIGTTGNTPLMVAPGGHHFEFVNQSLALRLRQFVDTPLGQVVTVSLDVPLGMLNLFSDEKAEVWIDGQLVGETPLSGVPTPLGSHEVVFRHAKYGEVRYVVMVTLAAPASVKVAFRKK